MKNRQSRKSTTCGLIAALNAANRLGNKISYSEGLELWDHLGFSRDTGLFAPGLSKILTALKVPHTTTYAYTLNDVKRALKDGKLVILLYLVGDSTHLDAHWILIDQLHPKSFGAWNWTLGKSRNMPFTHFNERLKATKVFWDGFYHLMFEIN